MDVSRTITAAIIYLPDIPLHITELPVMHALIGCAGSNFPMICQVSISNRINQNLLIFSALGRLSLFITVFLTFLIQILAFLLKDW